MCVCVHVCTPSRVQLCNPMNCSQPGSSVPGISQARILWWVALSFSRGSSDPGIDLPSLRLLHWGKFFRSWAIREAHFIHQFSSVSLCVTPWDPIDCSMPGLPVHHQLPELVQTQFHRVSYAIQPSHLLSSPSPPAFYLSRHQGLFKWVSSSRQVAKVLEFQL